MNIKIIKAKRLLFQHHFFEFGISKKGNVFYFIFSLALFDHSTQGAFNRIIYGFFVMYKTHLKVYMKNQAADRWSDPSTFKVQALKAFSLASSSLLVIVP